MKYILRLHQSYILSIIFSNQKKYKQKKINLQYMLTININLAYILWLGFKYFVHVTVILLMTDGMKRYLNDQRENNDKSISFLCFYI